CFAEPPKPGPSPFKLVRHVLGAGEQMLVLRQHDLPIAWTGPGRGLNARWLKLQGVLAIMLGAQPQLDRPRGVGSSAVRRKRDFQSAAIAGKRCGGCLSAIDKRHRVD